MDSVTVASGPIGGLKTYTNKQPQKGTTPKITISFGDRLQKNIDNDHILIGFMNIKNLPKSWTGQKNRLITPHYWLKLQPLRTGRKGGTLYLTNLRQQQTHRVQGHFMHQQIDAKVGYNLHSRISWFYQTNRKISLITGNFIGSRKKSNSNQ